MDSDESWKWCRTDLEQINIQWQRIRSLDSRTKYRSFVFTESNQLVVRSRSRLPRSDHSEGRFDPLDDGASDDFSFRVDEQEDFAVGEYCCGQLCCREFHVDRFEDLLDLAPSQLQFRVRCPTNGGRLTFRPTVPPDTASTEMIRPPV